MKHGIYIVGFILLLTSCSNKTTEENHSETKTEMVKKYIENLPDTVLTSSDKDENEFQFDLTTINIDIEKTTKLAGEWEIEQGEFSFHYSYAKKGGRVVFFDTLSSSMTGWGLITYNHAVKFYITEYSSHMYEYFINDAGKLVFILFEYRNDDLSMKSSP